MTLRTRDALQMHTVVDQPLTALSRGRISCRPIGQEPIEFEWTGPNGASVELDATGSEAVAATPGRYRVVVRDATGATADVVLDVQPVLTTACVIDEYRTSNASTSSSRDGGVEAVGEGLEGWRFLWTNGVETDGPVLRDVPCGTYAAIPLPSGERAPVLVHQCAPGRVAVESLSR